MDPDRARELLAAERARIERSLAHLERQDTGEPADEVDPGNLSSELYQAEFDEGLADELQEQLAAVDRAEARLADGTYGLSVESGKPIPDARLEAVPTAEADRRGRSSLAEPARAATQARRRCASSCDNSRRTRDGRALDDVAGDCACELAGVGGGDPDPGEVRRGKATSASARPRRRSRCAGRR